MLLFFAFVITFVVGGYAGALVARGRRRIRALKDALLRVQNLDALENAYVAALNARTFWEKRQNANQITLYNVVQFALLWNMDLSALLNALEDTKSGWINKLHARVLALTIYECAEDFRALLGKDFRKVIEDVGGVQAITAINPVSAGINQFWSTHQKALKEIRNSVIAHRDHDAKRQIDALNRLSTDDVKRMGFELMSWTTQLYHVLTSLIASPPVAGHKPTV